ncbi:MAG: CDP-alcohol phosphatidyltransferase family protein [Nitrososphaeraceae archaeon]|nr:CDP-alcohol phosphatidyltransferase family protein [Nitrososphaeraceae archaeon]
MLNKLRDLLEPTLTKIGASFASTGLSANFWTGLGLAVSVLAAIAYSTNVLIESDWSPWNFAYVIGGIFLLLSGFFDIVDGSVARITKQMSKKGAFLDSVFDKIGEVIIFGGIALGQLADSFWCLVALGMSLLVSYTRARAESLGGKLKGVGIGERAERLLIIAIIGMIPMREAMQWAMIIVSIVAGITLAQRVVVTVRRLSSTEA